MTYYKYNSLIINSIDRFKKFCKENETDCVNWTGSKDRDGYGRFCMNTVDGFKIIKAHRFSWMIANQQDWPTNMPVARHTCNNPSCVNPAHIIPGTHKENSEDMIKAGRNAIVYNGRKPVKTPIGNFVSVKEAAKFHKVLGETIRNRIRKGIPGYEYI